MNANHVSYRATIFRVVLRQVPAGLMTVRYLFCRSLGIQVGSHLPIDCPIEQILDLTPTYIHMIFNYLTCKLNLPTSWVGIHAQLVRSTRRLPTSVKDGVRLSKIREGQNNAMFPATWYLRCCAENWLLVKKYCTKIGHQSVWKMLCLGAVRMYRTALSNYGANISVKCNFWASKSVNLFKPMLGTEASLELYLVMVIMPRHFCAMLRSLIISGWLPFRAAARNNVSHLRSSCRISAQSRDRSRDPRHVTAPKPDFWFQVVLPWRLGSGQT